ncbi:hypothetical protein [Xanthomonas oryzae]|uniref:hypothetical protein n=1 Tax=Xanthomonas oryzae TaxID=347 RepID=UPI0005D80E2C|nr:hypothetical protein [Xanthomonas oryzae]AJQ85419.1 hypothetical protein AZ54_06150 [Xanthomonas oryzae pv. oryzae PXO86]MDI9070224.1 hypothetical protein [Xanthomonas oryzae pv. oryzae]MDI9080643.1 hypothetical protein [Xanthomonas oryzae pv. oryzae]MDI9102920.1 hypothetical protein [Xanthomonas oryzae pv. oryzae]MDI9911650.1 hypothetical protein [Xanthomonas oryzae pv. oryzae]
MGATSLHYLAPPREVVWVGLRLNTRRPSASRSMAMGASSLIVTSTTWSRRS